jgi:hypothetical protein
MPFRGPLILCLLVAVLAVAGARAPLCKAITIDVRLSCEILGGCGAGDFFIDNPDALTALEFAVRAFEPLTDSLSAIPASPGWTATFTNPESGSSGATASNLAVPANTLILYAGGWDMPGNQVGEAGPGTANLSLSRGQGTIVGASAFDFATWGGSIAFDTLSNDAPRNWHFGTFTRPGPGQVDFLTIAFHELAHVFGFGIAASFENLVSNNQFQGAATVGLTGTTVGLAVGTHWVSGTTSPPYAEQLPAALTPSLFLGRRTPLTPLDYAALKDLGWQVPDKLLGLHGDMDGDGDVDGRDLLLWQRGIGDADENFTADAFDLWLWQNNYGRRVAVNPLTGTVQVPEPSGLVLGFGIFLLLRRFHRS